MYLSQLIRRACIEHVKQIDHATEYQFANPIRHKTS
jgi:hypothetical protein